MIARMDDGTGGDALVEEASESTIGRPKRQIARNR